MDSLPQRRLALPSVVIVLLAIAPVLVELPGTALTLRHAADWLGWLGAGLLSSSLLLAVREPWIAHWFGGMERMYRWHHAFGVLACAVLVSHPLTLAAAAMSVSAARAWSLLSPARWFPANALGWLALLGLSMGLTAALMGRLPYRVWRRLHVLLSAAVLLGVAHIFAYRGLTASLVLVAAPCVLAIGWRLLRVDRGMGAHPYEVAAVSRIAAETLEIVLRPLATAVKVAPGQFVMTAFFEGPRYHGCGEFHPYTVCDSRADGSLVLAIKALGDCTARIQHLRRGVAARVQGPFGGVLSEDSSRPSLWIAGGIGITTFIARLRGSTVSASTKLIYAYRSVDAAAYLTELKSLAERQPMFGLTTLVLQEDLHALFAQLDVTENLHTLCVHLSGPPPFVRAVVAELRARGVPRSNLHVEEFSFTGT